MTSSDIVQVRIPRRCYDGRKRSAVNDAISIECVQTQCCTEDGKEERDAVGQKKVLRGIREEVCGAGESDCSRGTVLSAEVSLAMYWLG